MRITAYIPYLQFRSNCIVKYVQPDRTYSSSIDRYDLSQDKSEKYTGKVTTGARKRIAKAITLLIQSSPERRVLNPVTMKFQKFKLSFITLTISDNKRNLTAKEAYKLLLEPFLRTCRERFGVTAYVWKAELQKRGQIHYHITSNAFIPHSQVRECWNNLQRKHGLLNDFKARYGHENPNSTDIHSVYKIKNLEAYLVKYLCKVEGEKAATVGKVWDCSLNLKKHNYFTEFGDNEISIKLADLVLSGRVKKRITDNCEIYFFQDFEPVSILTEQGKERFKAFKLAVAG